MSIAQTIDTALTEVKAASDALARMLASTEPAKFMDHTADLIARLESAEKNLLAARLVCLAIVAEDARAEAKKMAKY